MMMMMMMMMMIIHADIPVCWFARQQLFSWWILYQQKKISSQSTIKSYKIPMFLTSTSTLSHVFPCFPHVLHGVKITARRFLKTTSFWRPRRQGTLGAGLHRLVQPQGLEWSPLGAEPAQWAQEGSDSTGCAGPGRGKHGQNHATNFQHMVFLLRSLMFNGV